MNTYVQVHDTTGVGNASLAMVDVFCQQKQRKRQLVQATMVQQVPFFSIEPSSFVDEDAEAVKQKHLKEVREEEELSEMVLRSSCPKGD